MPVARDDDVTICCPGTAQDFVIVWIVVNDGVDGLECDYRRQGAVAQDKLVGGRVGSGKSLDKLFTLQDVFDLCQEGWAGEEFDRAAARCVQNRSFSTVPEQS